MRHVFVGHVFNQAQIDDLRPAIRAGAPIAGRRSFGSPMSTRVPDYYTRS